MLNLLPSEVWRVRNPARFLEPACGEGAFLVEIYKRKLQAVIEIANRNNATQEQWEWAIALQTSSIYGIELLEDNAEQCAENLMRVFRSLYEEKFPDSQDEETIKTIQFLISRNILQGNALTYRRCTTDCGNDCRKCDLIIFSEWTPIFPVNSQTAQYQFHRKDYTYKGLIMAEKIRRTSKGGVFENEEPDNGLVKDYKPIYWKEIRYA
jgi:hypothetical protein